MCAWEMEDERENEIDFTVHRANNKADSKCRGLDSQISKERNSACIDGEGVSGIGKGRFIISLYIEILCERSEQFYNHVNVQSNDIEC